MKDGKFTDKELKALTEYLKPDGRKAIDGFLTTISSDSPGIRIPDSVTSGSDLRKFMGQIEDLYALLCKYGATHELPAEAFVLEDDDKFGDGKGGLHIEPRFKSLPVKKYNYEKDIGSYIPTDNRRIKNGYEPFHIPFVNLRDVLVEEGKDEILFGPNQGYSYQDKKDRRQVIVEEVKSVPRYSEKKHGISDAELDVCVEYLRSSTSDLSSQEFDYLRKMSAKMHTFMDARLETIRSMSMDKVLQVGDVITKKGMDYTDYLKKISDAMGEVPSPEMIITEEDLRRDREAFEVLKSGLGFTDATSFDSLTELRKRGIETMPQNRELSTEDLKIILNARIKSGNKDFVRLLATRGLLPDEVLSVGNTLTPLGVDHASFLQHEVGSLTTEEREGIIVTDAYREETIKNLCYEIKNKPESYDLLVESGMKLVEDDLRPFLAKNETYQQLSGINLRGRLGPIMGDTEGFLQSVSERLDLGLGKTKSKDDYIK